MRRLIRIELHKKMIALSFYTLFILSLTSFVNPMPATTFIVPDYPPQLSLFSRVVNPKPTVATDQLSLKGSAKGDFSNWASYAMSVMASKINNTFFNIKDKMKKSVFTDDGKRIEHPHNHENSMSNNHSDKTLNNSNNNVKNIFKNSKAITKLDLVSTTLVPSSIKSASSSTIPTTVVPNVVSTTPSSFQMKSGAIMMPQKKTEDMNFAKTADPINVHAERRHLNLPVRTVVDPNVFGTHFSLADDPRDYHQFSNYLSHLLANHHFDPNENKIIVRTPDFFSPVPTPAAYFPLFVPRPEQPFLGFQNNQWVKNQFGGVDINSKNDLGSSQLPSTPSTTSEISVTSMSSMTSSTTAMPPTTQSTSVPLTTTTTTTSPKSEVEEFPKPIKLIDTSQEGIKPPTAIRPIISVPFEAIITITRESHPPLSSTSPPLIKPLSTSSSQITFNQDPRNYYEIVTRDPPDEYPPFFVRNNTLRNEFKKVNVIPEDKVSIKNRNQSADQNKNKKNDCDGINSTPEESSTVNVVLENTIPTLIRNNGTKKIEDNFQKNDFHDDEVTVDDVPVRKNKNKKDKSRKRQTSAIKQLFQILGFFNKKVNENNSTNVSLSTSPVVKVFTANRSPGVKFEQSPSIRGRRNQTLINQEIPDDSKAPKDEYVPTNENPLKIDDASQNQEFDDDNDDGEGGGSLGSITDLLPLVVPVLEDLSDPESDTDLAELLEAGIPLIQGLSEGENEDGTPINIAATISPIIKTISAGKNGQDSDSGAILTPIVSLAAPLIGPVLGPIIGPLLRAISNPNSEGAFLPGLIQTLSDPLLQPTEPGGRSPLSKLIAETIAELSKDLSSGGYGGVDLKALISAVISGALAGTSAVLSGNDKVEHISGYGNNGPYKPDSYGAYANYGPATVPAHSVNPLELIVSTIKDILGASGSLVSTLIDAVSKVLGASSAGSSSSDDPPSYGPPAPYGPPPSYGPPAPNKNPTSSSFTGFKPPPRNISQKNTFNRP